MKIIAFLLLLLATPAFSEAKFGANYLRYTENGFTEDRSYKLWFSMNEPFVSNNRFGLGIHTEYENLHNGESIYGEIKPYYELFQNSFKVDLQFVHAGWKDSLVQDFDRRVKVGVGFEWKLWN